MIQQYTSLLYGYDSVTTTATAKGYNLCRITIALREPNINSINISYLSSISSITSPSEKSSKSENTSSFKSPVSVAFTSSTAPASSLQNSGMNIDLKHALKHT